MLTMVLLNVASTWAMPVWTFLLPFALTTLIGSSMAFGSSERFSSFFGSAGAAPASPFLGAFLPLAALGFSAVAAAAGVSATGVAGASEAGKGTVSATSGA